MASFVFPTMDQQFVGLETLKALRFTSYDAWNLSFPGEDFMEEDEPDVINELDEVKGDSKRLLRFLLKILCILDESSDYAEMFSDPEFHALSKNISDEVPHNVPCYLLYPLSSLLCFVTYGYSGDEGYPPNLNDEEGENPVEEDGDGPSPPWFKPLLSSILRCSQECPGNSGYLLAIDNLFQSSFSSLCLKFVGLNEILEICRKIICGELAVPAITVVSAVRCYCHYLQCDNLSSSQSISKFEILSQFMKRSLDQLSNTSEIDEEFLQLSKICSASILLTARKCTNDSEGKQFLSDNGLIPSAISFCLKFCSTFPVIPPKVPGVYHTPSLNDENLDLLSSTSILLHSFCTPQKIKIENCDDHNQMKTIYEEFKRSLQPIVHQIIEWKGHLIMSFACFIDDSGNHLQSSNSFHLSGLLALLSFANEIMVKVICDDIHSGVPRFLDCLSTHASNQIWTYSGRWSSNVMGMTKEACISRLLISLYFPTSSLVQPPETPAAILAAALQSRGFPGTRHYVVDDWMLSLAFLPVTEK